MILARRAGAAVAALALTVLPAAAPLAAADGTQVTERCRVTDERLEELSGLASDGSSWYAVADGGQQLDVFVVDPKDCSVRDVRTAPTNPYDVEDLALASDGTVWLADTGDNNRRRETVALHTVSPTGESSLYRIAYPDGPHDAEALLLDRQGVPHIVTKEPFGMAGVYRPTGSGLRGRSEETVPLEQVSSVMIRSTDSPGGPLSGTLGSILITGGSVSRDGTAVALRTYTDAYVYNAPDGDVVAALEREPLRIPLPHEAQGEAVAWEPDGTLLSASEGQQPVRAVPNALAAARADAPMDTADPRPAPGANDAASADPEQGKEATVSVLLLTAAAAALIFFVVGRLRRR